MHHGVVFGASHTHGHGLPANLAHPRINGLNASTCLSSLNWLTELATLVLVSCRFSSDNKFQFPVERHQIYTVFKKKRRDKKYHAPEKFAKVPSHPYPTYGHLHSNSGRPLFFVVYHA